MKKNKKMKSVITFENEDRRFWSREIGERRETDFILLAKLPDQKETLFASTVGGNLAKNYEKNAVGDLQNISLLKEKGGRYRLKIFWNDEEQNYLDREQFVLLFIAPNSDQTDNDNTLVFNFPSLLGEKQYVNCFFSDKNSGNAVATFWLLKEFF